ncbi:MAG TPA: hypothetical protein DCM27_01070, partial [Rhodospirillaceae bacterium]|nr:hypothetical protein [Rhodospirillaceae bacterium]
LKKEDIAGMMWMPVPVVIPIQPMSIPTANAVEPDIIRSRKAQATILQAMAEIMPFIHIVMLE